MKKVAGTLRINLANYRELESFAQFGSDLDEATQRQLARGSRLVELLKQGQYQPIEVTNQVMAIFGAIKGLFDAIPVDKIQAAEKDLIEYLNSKHADLTGAIRKENAISSESEGKLVEAIKSFVANYKH
jgi:F-type H+-transporting ATPase subunit alpha